MKQTHWQLALGLALCALVPVMTVARNRVTRPFKMEAQSQMVLSLEGGDFSSTASINASHCGRSVGLGWGTFNSATGEGSGQGKIIAANGDEIFFDMPSVVRNLITGGTGRFASASGEFNVVAIEQTGMEIDPVAGTVTLSFVWTAVGTLTF